MIKSCFFPLPAWQNAPHHPLQGPDLLPPAVFWCHSLHPNEREKANLGVPCVWQESSLRTSHYWWVSKAELRIKMSCSCLKLRWFPSFFNSIYLISLLLVKNSWPAPSDSPSCQDFVLLKAKVIIMKAILSEFLCFPRCKQHTLYFLLMEQLYNSGRVDKRQSK